MAALIYLVWPGQFIYITIVTEEHIVALMLVAVTALLLDAYHAICDADLPSRSIWIKFICAGALCGISSPFRDFAVIFLIAAIIYGFVLVFSQRKGISKRIIIAIAIVLLSRAAANMSLTGLVSYCTGLQMDENIVIAQMYWRLAPDGWGRYDAQRIQEYSDLVEAHDYDFDSANHDAMQILIGKIQAAYYKMPKLLLRKRIASYADNGDLFFGPV